MSSRRGPSDDAGPDRSARPTSRSWSYWRTRSGCWPPARRRAAGRTNSSASADRPGDQLGAYGVGDPERARKLTRQSRSKHAPQSQRNRHGHDVSPHIMTLRTIFMAALLAFGLACSPCIDNPFTEDVACDGEACVGAGETGGSPTVCTPLYEPVFVDKSMFCGPDESTVEHCTQDAANNYHVTDYVIESSAATYAVKHDFVNVYAVDDPGEPGADYWTWSQNFMTALPGVATHDDNLGGTAAAFISRGCCAQSVVGGYEANWVPHNPACQSGYALRDTPLGWCLGIGDGSQAGMCVYPCTSSNDCPNPTGEFCDLERPDPYSQAPGVCRYKSMPTIPTQLADIGN